MPQLDQLMEVYASQLFWLLISVGIVYFAIGSNMVPKINGTVDAREQKVEDDVAAAERANEDADRIEEDYRTRINEAREQASSQIHGARLDIAAKNEKRVAKVDDELADKAAAAAAELETAKSAALKEVEAVAAEAAKDIVSRLSGAKVTAAAAKSAVKSEFERA